MAYYFASDVHLGLSYREQDPRMLEQRFVRWLDLISHDCEKLFLVGDVIDFWFEWRRVVPRGHVRLLGKLAQMSDQGIEIHYFAGNHDLWITDYFSEELRAVIHTTSFDTELFGQRVFIAHGDNIGKRDFAGRTLSALFRSKTARWFFSTFLHPDLAMRFGKWWSSSSRHSRESVSHVWRNEGEPVVGFARERIEQHRQGDYRYFIFGHYHTAVEYTLTPRAELVVLGEWIHRPTYGKMDESGVLKLLEFS